MLDFQFIELKIAIIRDELSKPTLDDAIKVVEEIAKTNKDQYSVHMVKLQAYDEVLTALKGLKEGKEEMLRE